MLTKQHLTTPPLIPWRVRILPLAERLRLHVGSYLMSIRRDAIESAMTPNAMYIPYWRFTNGTKDRP